MDETFAMDTKARGEEGGEVNYQEKQKGFSPSSRRLRTFQVMVITGSIIWLFVRLSTLCLLSWSPYSSAAHLSDLDRWVNDEKEIAVAAILANIGASAGAGDGLVIASPSRGEKAEPDYFYTWTRDSALTFSSLLPAFLPDSYLRPWAYTTVTVPDSHCPLADPNGTELLLRDYIRSQRSLQLLRTRSGEPLWGSLDEPKFEANGSVYSGDWGRPQRDGPALRALTLIPYAQYLLDQPHPDMQYITHNLYDPRHIRVEGSVIKNDLEQVAQKWSEEGFDIWEEVNGHHLFTRLVSLRALQAGALLAARLDDIGAAEWYAKIAERIESRLAYFWIYHGHGERKQGYWTVSIFGRDQLHGAAPSIRSDETAKHPQEGEAQEGAEGLESQELNNNAPKTGLDCAFCLAVIHAGARRALNDSNEASWTSFEPSHPGVIGTLHEYVTSFGGIYPVNGARKWTEGWLLGRYAEDVYDGVGSSHGNPWFICTFSLAHTLYLAHTSFVRANIIVITYHTGPFWRDVLHNPSISDDESWLAGSEEYETALRELWTVAVSYLDVARNHTDRGSMSEQVDRLTGRMRGARDLTWSYASFVELSRTRAAARAEWAEKEFELDHTQPVQVPGMPRWTSWTSWTSCSWMINLSPARWR